MARILVMVISTLVAGTHLCHAGEGIRILQGDGVVVLYDPQVEKAALAVAEMVPGVRARLKDIFGWDLDMEPVVRLVADHERFVRMAGTPLIVAYALPGRDRLVIDHTRMGMRPFTLEITLRHELCHLLLHRHIEPRLLPRWLDEGVCQWASDGIGEILPDPKKDTLDRAALQGRLIPLRHLDDGFPLQEDALMLAYAVSKGFVDFLIAEFGKTDVLSLLGRLKAGQDVYAALFDTFGLGPEALEARWHESLARKSRLMLRVIRHLYPLLFAVGALLTLCAFIRVLLKKRARMTAMEEEERGANGAGSSR